jgi:AraC family transcriptional regulator of adaptative response / DNA-3-methyladenine glycosylase II
MSPTALRKSLTTGNIPTSGITVQLGYHPPYCWKEILKFLSQRAISGVEKITSKKYMRTVHLPDKNEAWCSG